MQISTNIQFLDIMSSTNITVIWSYKHGHNENTIVFKLKDQNMKMRKLHLERNLETFLFDTMRYTETD